MNDRSFSLPSKIDGYFSTLSRLYERTGETLLRRIVVNGGVSIHEGWDYDNWNGGTYGHAITLKLSEELYLDLIDQADEIRSRIALDLNKLNCSHNEHISEVFLEMEPSSQDRWREESGIYRPQLVPSSIPADALLRIWGEEHVRVFLSHKSSVKEQTSNLKQSLKRCGIAAFVAHEDIEPTEEWQREIERALFSMDALVALLTADYHESRWTDQEVGVAIGRGVPMLAVRLGLDPYGLMGKVQGIGGCRFEDTDAIAIKIYQLLHKRMSDKSRLFECALSAYKLSVNWADSSWKVQHLFSPFELMAESQVQRLVEVYHNNPQNLRSFDGIDQLLPLLKRWTGKDWVSTKTGLEQAGEFSKPSERFDDPF